jgi:hypothetical protein
MSTPAAVRFQVRVYNGCSAGLHNIKGSKVLNYVMALLMILFLWYF